MSASPDPALTDALTRATETEGLEIPAGQPADAATVAAVEATFRQMFACFNAGNDLAAFAFWTDNALRQFQVAPPTGTPTPVPEGGRSAYRITQVVMLPDGMVAVVWEQLDFAFSSTVVQVLVREGDRYLIDRTVDISFSAVETPPLDPATPAG